MVPAGTDLAVKLLRSDPVVCDLPAGIYGFFGGKLKSLILTPPTLNKLSPPKLSSIFVESDGIAGSMTFVQNVVFVNPF